MTEVRSDEARVKARLKRLALWTTVLITVALIAVWIASWRMWLLNQEHQRLNQQVAATTEQLEKLKAKNEAEAARIEQLHEAVTYFQSAAEVIHSEDRDQLSNALRKLIQAKARRAEDPYVTQMIGAVFFLNGQYSQAIPYYEEALKYKPDFPRASFDLARAACKERRFDMAKASLSKAISGDPQYGELAKRDAILRESCPQLVA